MFKNCGRFAPALVCALVLCTQTIFLPLIHPLAAGPTSDESRDWSRAMVDSTIKRYPDALSLGSWGYAKSLYLWGEYLVWKRTGDPKYLQYIKAWVDSHVDEQGNVKNKFENLDSMLPGNLLLVLYRETK